ncbi:hypothetical protein V2I01_27750 [Micromonospora sp. BRA006-A]|nr:hypothetical protein [Micromonospora sp. BRA006-A]
MSSGRRAVVGIAAGSAGGQPLALAAAPLLARLYRPVDFGVLAVVAALVVIVGTVAALRFEMAVPLPEREEDARALVRLGLAAAAGTAILGSVVVLLVGDRVAAWFGQPELVHWLCGAALRRGDGCRPGAQPVRGAEPSLRRDRPAQPPAVPGGRGHPGRGGGGGAPSRWPGARLRVRSGRGRRGPVRGTGERDATARTPRRRPRLLAVARRYRRFPSCWLRPACSTSSARSCRCCSSPTGTARRWPAGWD